jgi:hypothetical protein
MHEIVAKENDDSRWSSDGMVENYWAEKMKKVHTVDSAGRNDDEDLKQR